MSDLHSRMASLASGVKQSDIERRDGRAVSRRKPPTLATKWTRARWSWA